MTVSTVVHKREKRTPPQKVVSTAKRRWVVLGGAPTLTPSPWCNMMLRTVQNEFLVFEQAFKDIGDVPWKEAGCTTELDYAGAMGMMG